MSEGKQPRPHRTSITSVRPCEIRSQPGQLQLPHTMCGPRMASLSRVFGYQLKAREAQGRAFADIARCGRISLTMHVPSLRHLHLLQVRVTVFGEDADQCLDTLSHGNSDLHDSRHTEAESEISRSSQAVK